MNNSAEKAKIIIFEDDVTWLKDYERYLLNAGFSAYVFIKSMAEAAAFLESHQFDGDEVALIDGNLSPYSFEGSDGKAIAADLRSKGVFTIGMSGSRMRRIVDLDLTKNRGAKEPIEIAIHHLQKKSEGS